MKILLNFQNSESQLYFQSILNYLLSSVVFFWTNEGKFTLFPSKHWLKNVKPFIRPWKSKRKPNYTKRTVLSSKKKQEMYHNESRHKGHKYFLSMSLKNHESVNFGTNALLHIGTLSMFTLEPFKILKLCVFYVY